MLVAEFGVKNVPNASCLCGRMEGVTEAVKVFLTLECGICR